MVILMDRSRPSPADSSREVHATPSHFQWVTFPLGVLKWSPLGFEWPGPGPRVRSPQYSSIGAFFKWSV